MLQRKEVVLSVLRELQDATESSGLDALTRAAMEVDQVLAPFQLPRTPCQDFPEWTSVDDAAHGLYPMDAPADLLPINCKGEGNLLFDAVSMLLVGSTALSLELQVRTVVEMVLWKRYYLSGMIDSKMMLQAVRFSLSAEESEDMLNLPATVLEAIFDADVKASCFPGSYANMWHVYALSSVLQFNIYSVYPMFNPKIRPYFNRMIRPRTKASDSQVSTLHVMWSGELLSESVFRPNHFVALVHSSDLRLGSPDQRRSPIKREELPNPSSRFTYPSLKDKYNITKRTFYRWKRQSQEHCNKSAARYEAKNFLQACYLQGNLIPLHQFKQFFPDISRSSYYNWKHELMKSGGAFSTTSSGGEISPTESTEHDAWSSPEAKHDDLDQHDSVASMFGLSMVEQDRVQNTTHMQEAKRCLQTCIAMNTSFPFRIFKRSYPGISRSTYYNWRREAMLFNRGYKTSGGSSSDSSDADKSQSPKNLTQVHVERPTEPRVKVCRRKHKKFRQAYLSKKQLRDAAKLHAPKLPLAKFMLKFPSMSPCFYWLWRNGKNRKIQKSDEASLPPALEANAVMKQIPERGFGLVEPAGEATRFVGNFAACFDAPQTRIPLHSKMPMEEQMFGMDVVALANFKVKAKLFLQQRFEEKSFPSFKEFRSYFPFTPRSTYYMWKRALHHGISLIHG